MMRTDLSFRHVARLSEPLGLFEHALGTAPRREHGYCVDDVARALIVTSRVPDPSPQVENPPRRLSRLRARCCARGRTHAQPSRRRRALDRPTVLERPLGTRACGPWLSRPPRSTTSSVAERARLGASLAMRSRSVWPRAMAYAALGAAQYLRSVLPATPRAIRLLSDARRVLDHSRPDARWPWPEERLTYANAVLPEAMIVIGGELADEALRDDGLLLLDWLARQQTSDGHLSLVPSTGWSHADRRPGYAQQPIEAAVLAEACRAAYLATSHPRWLAVDRHVPRVVRRGATTRAWSCAMPTPEEASTASSAGMPVSTRAPSRRSPGSPRPRWRPCRSSRSAGDPRRRTRRGSVVPSTCCGPITTVW